jgi:phosphatidylglycerophosphate synthase
VRPWLQSGACARPLDFTVRGRGMPWWLLLVIVTAVWFLAAFACLVASAVSRKRLGITSVGRGESIAQFVVLPPLFLGIAFVLNLIASPWGTRLVGSLHVLFGVVLMTYIGWGLHYLNVRTP